MSASSSLSPATAQILADALLALHVGVVLAVVGGECLILLGGWRGWTWVRHRGLRLAHLGTIAFIVAQSWLGELCPLTVWEQALRDQAGRGGYAGGLIEYWLSRLLYIEAPWWAFVAAYTAFGALVAASWVWIPPRPRNRP